MKKLYHYKYPLRTVTVGRVIMLFHGEYIKHWSVEVLHVCMLHSLFIFYFCTVINLLLVRKPFHFSTMIVDWFTETCVSPPSLWMLLGNGNWAVWNLCGNFQKIPCLHQSCFTTSTNIILLK